MFLSAVSVSQGQVRVQLSLVQGMLEKIQAPPPSTNMIFFLSKQIQEENRTAPEILGHCAAQGCSHAHLIAIFVTEVVCTSAGQRQREYHQLRYPYDLHCDRRIYW